MRQFFIKKFVTGGFVFSQSASSLLSVQSYTVLHILSRSRYPAYAARSTCSLPQFPLHAVVLILEVSHIHMYAEQLSLSSFQMGSVHAFLYHPGCLSEASGKQSSWNLSKKLLCCVKPGYHQDIINRLIVRHTSVIS